MSDREEMQANRAAGLVKRYETRWQLLPDASLTYAPDATECSVGHPFASEADCVLPEGWDQFMCRTCIQIAIAADPLPNEEGS